MVGVWVPAAITVFTAACRRLRVLVCQSPQEKDNSRSAIQKTFRLVHGCERAAGERDSAKRKADAWLKQHQKNRKRSLQCRTQATISLTRSGQDTVAHLASTTPIQLRCTFSDGQRRGYRRAQFEEALSNDRRPSRAGQLRLISQSDV